MNELADNPSSGRRPPRLRLASFFWLQFLLSPLFLSPLSQRIDTRKSPVLALLVFLVAPLLYTAAFAWLSQRRGYQKEAWVRGAMFGMLFGMLGFLPHAVNGIIGLIRAFDPSLPISRWTMVAESLQVLVVLLFFMVFYGLLGTAGGTLIRAAELCRLIESPAPRPVGKGAAGARIKNNTAAVEHERIAASRVSQSHQPASFLR